MDGPASQNRFPHPPEEPARRPVQSVPLFPKTPRTQKQEQAYKALLEVDRFCREHGISYFLLAGTVLGAVRHGGFIPWDDDIDLGMTPENLERFYQICPTHMSGGFVFSYPENNSRHPRFFGKILCQGRHLVDIFPIVPTSGRPVLRQLHFWRMRWLHLLHLRKLGVPLNRKGLNPKRLILYIMTRTLSCFYSRARILRLARRNLLRFQGQNTGWYLNLCSKYSAEKELIKADWLETLRPLPFEDGEFPAFAATDEYLTHLYGDYRILPPEEQRIAEHEDQVYEFGRESD